jgi:hypothetical protein
MAEAKPFGIEKRLVWEAWLRVKANQGAAGVDGESIARFEKRLRQNLYRIWNRMSSGTYFPPPVRSVTIPKPDGRERTLGIPMGRAYCTPYRKPRDRARLCCPVPCRHPDASLPGAVHPDDRFVQRRRTGFRSAAMTAGVSTTHHGPCGLAWVPSSRPALHHAITVAMSTFSRSAAARVE